MTDRLVDAIIAIAGVTVGAIARLLKEYLAYKIQIRSVGVNIPKLVGHWQVEWYLEDGKGESTLYSSDTINIKKQRGFNIFGKGSEKAGTYQLTGKLSMSNIVCFTYEFDSPLIASAGGGVLQIEPLGKTCTGLWYGFTKQCKIEGGKVVWKRA